MKFYYQFYHTEKWQELKYNVRFCKLSVCIMKITTKRFIN